ncbi:hypothetical protein ACF0H5_003327 [Mactra antiquata]
MRTAASKSEIKNKLQCQISSRVQENEAMIIDGCAAMWSVHWPNKAHALSGCDTVAQMYGIGKGTVITKLKTGQPLKHLGNLQSNIDVVVTEATQFIALCYSIKSKVDMSEVRVAVWAKKTGRKNITSAPELKISSTSSHAFKENVNSSPADSNMEGLPCL